MAVGARIESTTGRLSHVLATGVRLDLQRQAEFAIYGSALAGGLQRVHDVSNEEATTCTSADTFRRLVAGLVGFEVALSRAGRATIGLEAGYWYVFDGGSGTDLSHVGGALTLRYRVSPN